MVPHDSYRVRDPESGCSLELVSVYEVTTCQVKYATAFDGGKPEPAKSFEELADGLDFNGISRQHEIRYLAMDLLRRHVLNAHADDSFVKLAER